MRLARLTTLAVLALASLPSRAEEAETTVAWVQGEANATRGDLGTFPLAVKTRLEAGDVIATGPGGALEIALPTGSTLRLGSNSKLTLQDEPQGSFRARLSLGNLWAKVVKLVGGSRFEVETQNGVAGVRGTEFRVNAQASGQAMVRVYEGKVQVKGAAFDHLVLPGHELRFSAKAQLGPRTFDPKAERGFMRWVRRRDEAPRDRKGDKAGKKAEPDRDGPGGKDDGGKDAPAKEPLKERRDRLNKLRKQ